ncbi:MAG: cellulase family glycosylhydrolase, partial [bacterium]
RTGPGRSEFTFLLEDLDDWFDESYLNDSVWQDQEAQDAWAAMWRSTAERYRNNPIVVGYDLMVEPNANEVGSDFVNDRLDIWDPEQFYSNYGGTWYDWNQFYPHITAAIRQVDPNTPILIGGMAYSAVDWLPYVQPTADPYTVYTVHQYAPTVYTHQDTSAENTYPGVFDTDWDGDDDHFDRTWLENLFSTIDTFAATHGVPAAANEFGVVRWVPGADDFMDDQMDLFEQRGMNHALWLWETSWTPYAEEVDAFNFRHGPDPNNHSDVESSALIDVIVSYWGRNTIRPSVAGCQVRISSPNGGETWCVGESEDIAWTSENTSGNVTIEYSADNGSSWQPVIENTHDDGTHPWTVPDTSSTGCLVRICDVTDPDCCDTSDRSFQICECGTIEITTETLPDGTEGCAYSGILKATGGCLPYTWTIATGQLPGGLDLEGSSGTISGEPGEVGTFEFTVMVSDVLGDSAQREFSVQLGEYVNAKGDVNGDCMVDILDAVSAVNIILESAQPTEDQIWRADCNGSLGSCDGDGTVNVLDVVKIVNLILGLDECP